MALLRKGQADYYAKREKIAAAEDKWQRLYYCSYHDGVFMIGEGSPFIHLKNLEKYLFETSNREETVTELQS